MKKKLVSVLATALTVGAASTTFAAANPFSDVPSDHWAYDAVTQLAADGIIEGYGDTTFRGDRNITRYEMAQMVARAMAKSDVDAATKAMIDKLAAEFADELNNLGVRVSNLERNADMVKWTGEARYRYWSYRDERAGGRKEKTNVDSLQFRLFPTAEVNDHWHVKARLTGTTNMKNDTSGNMRLTYVYADGQYGDNFNVKVGKMPFYSTADDGLVMDDFFSGVQVNFGKELKVTLEAGRWNINNDGNGNFAGQDVDDAASYQGIELNYAPKKLAVGTAFRHFNSDIFRVANGYSRNGKEDSANIWSIGGKYTFDHNWALAAAYAKNTSADSFNHSHSIQLSYKGENKANKGSWGAFVAYRYLGQNVSLMPTFDTAHTYTGVNPLNDKGWDFGVSYVPLKNVLTKIGYFKGKDFNHRDADTLYGRVSFFV